MGMMSRSDLRTVPTETAAFGFDLADLRVGVGVANEEDVVLGGLSGGETAIAGVTGTEGDQVRVAMLLRFHSWLEGAAVELLGALLVLALRHLLVPSEQPELVAYGHIQLALKPCLRVRRALLLRWGRRAGLLLPF